jgi:large subunit ribosomal protein L24
MHIKVDDTLKSLPATIAASAARCSRSITRRGKDDRRRRQPCVQARATQPANPQGGRLSKEMPIQVVQRDADLQQCGQPSRTGVRFLDDGSKERYCKSVVPERRTGSGREKPREEVTNRPWSVLVERGGLGERIMILVCKKNTKTRFFRR